MISSYCYVKRESGHTHGYRNRYRRSYKSLLCSRAYGHLHASIRTVLFLRRKSMTGTHHLLLCRIIDSQIASHTLFQCPRSTPGISQSHLGPSSRRRLDLQPLLSTYQPVRMPLPWPWRESHTDTRPHLLSVLAHTSCSPFRRTLMTEVPG